MLRANAQVPSKLEHPDFVVVPLNPEIAALDYDAYMASPRAIHAHSDGRWPVDGFELADNVELVRQHRSDHRARRAFTFALLTTSRSEVLGCLYLNPLREFLRRAGASSQLLATVPEAAAMVTFWLRDDQQQSGLVQEVVRAVDDWLRHEWPLDVYLFRVLPGEQSSCEGLERCGFVRIDVALGAEVRPYRWFRPAPG